MECDPSNDGKAEELMWLMAAGGPSHGKKFGFGSKLDGTNIPTSNLRERPTSAVATTASEVTQEPPQGMHTTQEVVVMLQAREHQFAEELARRDQLETERNNHNNLMFSQLFSVVGMQAPQFNVRIKTRSYHNALLKLSIIILACANMVYDTKHNFFPN